VKNDIGHKGAAALPQSPKDIGNREQSNEAVYDGHAIDLTIQEPYVVVQRYVGDTINLNAEISSIDIQEHS